MGGHDACISHGPMLLQMSLSGFSGVGIFQHFWGTIPSSGSLHGRWSQSTAALLGSSSMHLIFAQPHIPGLHICAAGAWRRVWQAL